MNTPTTTEITNIVLAASLAFAWITIILQGMSIRRLRKSLRITDEAVLHLLKDRVRESAIDLFGTLLNGPKPCVSKKPEPKTDVAEKPGVDNEEPLSPLARIAKEQMERILKGE